MKDVATLLTVNRARMLKCLAGNFMCLIRPDGHLGFVSVPASTADLIRYLERITDAEAVRGAFDARVSADLRLRLVWARTT